MKRRILALAGIALLVLMYVLTLVFALIGSDWATRALQLSVVLIVAVPVVLWAFLMTLRRRGRLRDQARQAMEEAARGPEDIPDEDIPDKAVSGRSAANGTSGGGASDGRSE